jgi:hypothetical protein
VDFRASVDIFDKRRWDSNPPDRPARSLVLIPTTPFPLPIIIRNSVQFNSFDFY